MADFYINLRQDKETELTWEELDHNFVAIATELSLKQNTLVSGTNIKTINGNSILGSGDLVLAFTKTDIGLDQVDNTSDLDKPISNSVQIALGFKADEDKVYNKTDIDTKFNDLVGLAPTTLDTLNELATAILNNESDLGVFLNELDTKQVTLVSGTNVKTINGNSILGSGDLVLTKMDVGLGNADNTSDLNKPISNATQNALNTKQNSLVSGTNIKTINGVSILGSGDITLASDSGLLEIVQTLPTPDLTWLKRSIYVIDLSSEYVCVADTLTPTDADCFWLQR